MTLIERAQEAFDKRVCGTAMIDASDLLSLMTRIEQLEKQRDELAETNQWLLDRLGAYAQEIKTEQRLSFRDQVADLEKQRDELLDTIQHVIDEARLTSSQYELCRQAIASVKAKP